MVDLKRDILSIDLAFDDHMKSLFGTVVRHLQGGDVEGARKEFRKGLAIAQQARSEMVAIAGDGA